MYDVCSCHINGDLLAFLVIGRLAEGDVKDAQDVSGYHAGSWDTASTRVRPLLY